MKLVTNQHFKVSNEDIKKLLTKFIEKKTGKKVSSVEMDANGARVEIEVEETDYEENKSA